MRTDVSSGITPMYFHRQIQTNLSQRSLCLHVRLFSLVPPVFFLFLCVCKVQTKRKVNLNVNGRFNVVDMCFFSGKFMVLFKWRYRVLLNLHETARPTTSISILLMSWAASHAVPNTVFKALPVRVRGGPACDLYLGNRDDYGADGHLRRAQGPES